MNQISTRAEARQRELTCLNICVTVCHMKTITIRELHARTGRWLREVVRHGQIVVTDNGRPVARILPQSKVTERPYFADRKLSPAFRRLDKSGKLGRGPDSTALISEEREDRV